MSRSVKYISLIVIVLGALLAIYLSLAKRPETEKSDALSIPEVSKQELVGELVAGFPPLPVYPDAELEYSYVKSEDKMRGYEGKWTTQDSVYEVAGWYADSLSKSGWSMDSALAESNPESGAEQIVARKGVNVLYLTVENEDRIETEIIAEFPVREY